MINFTTNKFVSNEFVLVHFNQFQHPSYSTINVTVNQHLVPTTDSVNLFCQNTVKIVV